MGRGVADSQPGLCRTEAGAEQVFFFNYFILKSAPKFNLSNALALKSKPKQFRWIFPPKADLFVGVCGVPGP